MKKVSSEVKAGRGCVQSRSAAEGQSWLWVATTRGTEKSALSKKPTPPAKWSYLKFIGWSVLVFLFAGWLVLRQHRHNERDDCVVCSLDVLRLDFRRDLRSAAVSCLEA
jgi:hypothetical protein